MYNVCLWKQSRNNQTITLGVEEELRYLYLKKEKIKPHLYYSLFISCSTTQSHIQVHTSPVSFGQECKEPAEIRKQQGINPSRSRVLMDRQATINNAWDCESSTLMERYPGIWQLWEVALKDFTLPISVNYQPSSTCHSFCLVRDAQARSGPVSLLTKQSRGDVPQPDKALVHNQDKQLQCK